MTSVRLEPAALRSRVKHSTTEPLRSLNMSVYGNPDIYNFNNSVLHVALMPCIVPLNQTYGSGGVAENVKS